MELDEFVKEALTQIVLGVKNSQEEIRESGGFASPALSARVDNAGDSSFFGSIDRCQSVLLVDFDVAVTVSDTAEKSAGGRLAVASLFSAGAEGKASAGNESTSRIKFKVPLALPVDQETKANFERKTEKQRRQVNQNPNYNVL